MSLTEGAVGRVIQHQKGNLFLHSEIQHAHNVGVNKPTESTRLDKKRFTIIVVQLHREQLNGCLGPEVDMFPEIDLSKATFSEKTSKLIIAKLLSYLVCHCR